MSGRYCSLAVFRTSEEVDSDFPTDRRLEIKSYMEQRYGINQVCSVGTYSALQLKAAIKDFSRLKNVPFEEVNRVTRTISIDDRTMDDFFKKACSDKTLRTFVHKYPDMINEISIILGAPKARSIHACAMMIFPTEKDMYHWGPVRLQDGLMVSDWEGGELDSAGFLKEDILGILQLQKLKDIIDAIKKDTGEEINIYTIPQDDSEVYDYFQKGWTGDVFHFGARGLTNYCRDMKPKNITELINCIGLYRPGVMESNFHNEYILRKRGERESECRKGAESILNETENIMIWQEQTMKMFVQLGGFDLVKADTARRAIGKKKVQYILEYKDEFVRGYMEKFGVDKSYAEDTWKEIENMAAYQFNKSHAAAYASTGYICQWLKIHYPLQYWSTAFTYADDKDYPIYVAEMNLIGSVKMLSVDINKSGIKVSSSIKDSSMYWPLSSVKQAGEIACQQIFDDREKFGEYFSLEEFLDRHSFKGSKVNKSVIENLIVCGAFDSIEKINLSSERHRLVEEYRENSKVKINGEIDPFSLNENKMKLDWWWQLRCKQLSGFAFFDYKDLIKKHYKGDGVFYSVDELNEPDITRDRYMHTMVTGGYVYEYEVKQSKKGPYARLTLEQNYSFLKVVIFAEEFKDFEEFLSDCKNNILILEGTINYDKYNSCNVFQTFRQTNMLLLT